VEYQGKYRPYRRMRIGSASVTMTTGQDQSETLQTAAARTRSSVADPRFPGAVDQALEYFGPELATNVGRADVGEMFVPLEVWLGRWDQGAALVLQDRVVLAWGFGEVRTQVIARKRPGGVAEVDVQPDAITLWIDCDQPLNVRVERYTGEMDVPTAFADTLRQERREAAPTVALPPSEAQCPHCFEPVRADAEFCPACGRHIGPKPKRSKKLLIILIIALLLLLLLVGVAIALLSGDDEPTPPKASATPAETAEPTAEPTADAFRRITGPGWEGRAPREGWKISKVERLSDGKLLVRTLTGPDGAVIRIYHTPEEDANPGTFRTGDLKPLESNAAEGSVATVKNFGTPECEGRNCSDLLLNDPGWGGIAILVNATQGERLEAATAIAQSIEKR